MTALIVESAIASHKTWVLQFHCLTNDDSMSPSVSLEHIADEHGCEFGTLMDSGKLRFETPMLEEIARDLHGTFHQFAEMIVENRKRRGSRQEALEYLSELERVSEELVTVMRHARIAG